eukprot:2252491-Amphidinium_carterae.1
MPLSGSVPLKPLLHIANALTARITWSPLRGSAPTKLFKAIPKNVTALIVRMPLSGSVPLKPFLQIKNSAITNSVNALSGRTQNTLGREGVQKTTTAATTQIVRNGEKTDP